MKTHDHNTIIRKVFHKIHKDHIKSKAGFKRVKNLLNCENLKLAKPNDLKKIENIWIIKKSLPNCLKNY